MCVIIMQSAAWLRLDPQQKAVEPFLDPRSGMVGSGFTGTEEPDDDCSSRAPP